MLLGVWNLESFQFWAVIAAGAVIIWAYYEFWVEVLAPWIFRHSRKL
jgi:hypothetical protein